MDGPDPYYYRQSQKNTAYHNNYEVLMKTAKRCDTTRWRPRGSKLGLMSTVTTSSLVNKKTCLSFQ